MIEFGASFIVNVDASGRIIGFSNAKARGQLVHGGRLEVRSLDSPIRSREAALRRASEILSAAGLQAFTFGAEDVEMPSSVNPQTRETGMAGVVKVKGGELAPGHAGYVNDFGVELDGDTGRLLWLTASTRFRFERPGSVLSEGEALSALRRMVQANHERLLQRGLKPEQAKRFQWPGDAVARGAMRQRVVAGIGTTPQAVSWTEQGVARVAWGVFLPQWQALIDAETGEPLGVVSARSTPVATPAASSSVRGGSTGTKVPSAGSRPSQPEPARERPSAGLTPWVAGLASGALILFATGLIWARRRRS